MSKEVLSVFEVNEIMGKSRPKTGWAYDLCRDIEAAVISRFRAQGGNTSDNIGSDLANKATEEGDRERFEAWYFHKFGAQKMLGDSDQYHMPSAQGAWQAWQAAIAADRASRQVANKAEVEPVAHLKFWASQSWSGSGNHDIEHGEGLEVCNAGEIGDDGKPAFPVYATPPATTGASTACRPTDDELWDATLRDRDAYHDWADKLADAIAKHFGVDIGEHSNQNLPWDEALQAIENAEPVGASTVLTDERIEAIWCREAGEAEAGKRRIAFARAIEREVAAQAGQVAVPGWVSVDDRLPEVEQLVMVYAPTSKHEGENISFDCIDPNDDDHSSWLGHNEHYEHFCCVAKPEGSIGPSEKAPYTHWMPLPLPPSPAKESK